ncbi:hypothetical protein [Flavobacterium xinjiangense]|uniref:Uncharacterized protein n=1 Tax=Flavobacterium xinjiangense TaxID=178356 RepID=A0A1M7M6R9_9FLAO|nr:hypothetical protein [Flavobacterium xinjiangense]SHM86417.1 hypothetical protein SAMN05216269_1082 [Flavobacterium xinjiangense]
MNKKTVFYVLFLIGIVSIFLPFDIDNTINCGFEMGYYSDKDKTISFLAIFKNVSFHNFNFLNIIKMLLAILLIVPFIFSAIFFFYKKYIILIMLNLVPFVFFLILGLSRRFDQLQIGFYLLLFQQIALFYLLIKILFSIKTVKR